MKKGTLWLLFICVKFSVVNCQPGWTLQQCIEYAQKNNISIKISEINTEISKVNLTQSKASLLPSLNAGANHTYNIGRTIDRYTNTFANSTVLSQNFFLATQVTLWSGLSQYNLIKQNEYSYLAAKESIEQQKNDLALNVATSFLQVIYNEELKKASEIQVNTTKEQLERTKKLVEAGSLAKSAELDVNAQLANDEFTLTNAQNNYQLSLLSLKQLLMLDSANSFSIAKPELETISTDLMSLNVSDVYNFALKNQPIIKNAEFNIKSAEKSLAVSRGRISPTLSLSASLGTGYSGLAKDITGFNVTGYDTSAITTGGEFVLSPVFETITKEKPFADQFKDNVNKSFGFSINMPIFNGLSNYSSIKIAKYRMLSSKYALDQSKQQLYRTISQAHADAKAAMNKVEAAKKALEAANESLKLTEQRFNAGAISSFEYINSKNRQFRSEVDALNAKFDYIFRIKVLDFYQGKPLTF